MVSTTTYFLDTSSDHKVDVWVDIGRYEVLIYYVFKEVMESSNISDKIVKQPNNDLTLFHATNWKYMKDLLKKITVGYLF